MPVQRTERLLNLVICLIAATRYVSKEQIRSAVPQYADSATDEAFERMFERDKDDLREMGIPLETGSNEVYFDDEIGYRIPKDAYALPEVTFDSEELAVLGLAARAWQQATLADAALSAVRKLESAGIDVDRSALAVVEPRMGGDEPAFASLYEATRDRRPVSFSYGAAASQEPRERHLEPWGLVSWHGRWYVLGHDTDRGATRLFRLSRITSPVIFSGPPSSVEVPPDVDLSNTVRRLAPSPVAELARLRVGQGSAVPLRRRGTEISVSDSDGWSEIEIGFSDVEEFATEICGYGADVVVLKPDALKNAVINRFTTLIEQTQEAS